MCSDLLPSSLPFWLKPAASFPPAAQVLDIIPDKVHQRVPLFVGSKKEVEYLESFTKK